MKQSAYMTAILERLGKNQEIICQDCGEASQISHAVINHDDETVKIVCNDCFINKYRDFLYPENSEHTGAEVLHNERGKE